jgi:phage terminase large subunit GpA-like protein
MIDEQEYTDDEGRKYWIENTFIDSGDGKTEGVVSDFCSQYEYGVFPTKGDSYSSKRMQSFKEFNTSSKATGYMIAVDMYKDRMAPVLRRIWEPENGNQDRYQLNVPADTTDKEIKQLTTEFKKDEKQAGGRITKVWYRPHGVKNELWDLLIMAMCGIEILALNTCLGNLELEGLYMDEFWKYAQNEQAFFDLEK